MANQRQLNGGQQGAGSGLDADKLDGKEESSLDVDKVDGQNASDLGGISGESGNERVEYGYSDQGTVANDSFPTEASISFDNAFNSVPNIQHSLRLSFDNKYDFGEIFLFIPDFEGVSTTGFTLSFHNESGYSVGMAGYWQVIGE